MIIPRVLACSRATVAKKGLFASNPRKKSGLKYGFSSACCRASYMLITLRDPAFAAQISDNAFPATRQTFSMPPVAEKTLSVRKRMDLSIEILEITSELSEC